MTCYKFVSVVEYSGSY